MRGFEQIRLRNGSAQHLRGRIRVEPRGLIRVFVVFQYRDRNRTVLVDFRHVVDRAWRVVHLAHRNRGDDLVAHKTRNVLDRVGNRERAVVVGNRVDDNVFSIRRNRYGCVCARRRNAVDIDRFRRRVRNQIRVGIVGPHIDIRHRVFRHRQIIRNRRWRGVDVGHHDREFVGRFCACRVRCRNGDVGGSVPFAVWLQLQVTVAARAVREENTILKQNRVAALGGNGYLRRAFR